ncbi:MAG: isoprenoid biosynthesis glyoxalase ElbB [Myxococcota bacterium]|nr:isoprenoid biosynthesis glyoxalase ElbB [Myxococcota bacterium]MEC8422896.1 isoprenoid biosynthesis glyoxalase ElbB [Myxococcota bacterium]
MSTRKVCVILSGCGVFDGAEIHESVVTLLALARAGATYRCAAPDKPQMHVVNHLSGAVSPGEERNVLVEAARIARGTISPLSEVRADDYDAVFLPGGFGAAKNLSDFAVQGASGSADPDVVRVLREFRAAGKPIGAVCIAPAVLVLALGEGEVTIGSDADTAAAIGAAGGTHVVCPVDEMHVDEQRRLVTAPAYMIETTLDQVAEGIEKAVLATLSLCA